MKVKLLNDETVIEVEGKERKRVKKRAGEVIDHPDGQKLIDHGLAIAFVEPVAAPPEETPAKPAAAKPTKPKEQAKDPTSA